MCRKSRAIRREIGERYGEIEYRGGKSLQRWNGSGGNVRLPQLLMSVLISNLANRHTPPMTVACRDEETRIGK